MYNKTNMKIRSKTSITLKISQSYFDFYGKHIDKYYIKDNNIYIDVVKSMDERLAVSKLFNYLVDNNIGLINVDEYISMYENKMIRGDYDAETYHECRDNLFVNCKNIYISQLNAMYGITYDLPYICNRYSKEGFGQPNGWSIIIESS